MAEQVMLQTIVYGPEEHVTIPVMDDGSGPVEVERAVYLVEHESTQDPRWLAVRHARARGHEWSWSYIDSLTHPLDGVSQQRTADQDVDAWGEFYVSVEVV